MKHLNPETTFQLTEELAIAVLGKDTVLTRDYLTFENKEGKIIAFTGLSILPMYKDVHVTVYAVKPEYFESELPEMLIDATLDLKNRLNITEILIDTLGEISKPFDNKLKDLGYKPVNYAWSMYLDNFDLFSHPGVPEGINIRILKEMEDYAGAVNILNEAFADSFKYKPITKGKWKRMTDGLKKNNIVEHCVAYDNEKFTGMCDTLINLEQAQIGGIVNFGVLPDYQHRKIGSAILASGIENLREKGCKTIKLGVDTENEKALKLYKRFGFYVKKNLTRKIYQIN
jgi:ribosomal protein S18 acetylase RimI-like enzyme